MYRFALALILSTQAAAALAAGACTITGTAFDAGGRPMRDAVVRLTDLHTGHAAFIAADSNASFVFADLPSNSFRLDVLSPPTIVTGTKIPTRSILGMSDNFACSGQATRQDVRAQIY